MGLLFFFFLISKKDEYNQDEYKKDVGLTYQKKKRKEERCGITFIYLCGLLVLLFLEELLFQFYNLIG